MRVVLVNLAHAAELTVAEQLLDEYHSLTGWAEGLAAAGADVTVVQGFTSDQLVERNGVRYRFVAGSYAPRLSRRRIPWRALRAVRALRPDVVHLNGLLYFLQARALRAVLPSRSVLMAQHHAEKPDSGSVAWLQRWGLRAVDGFVFTGDEMAETWTESRMIGPRQPVFDIVEGSSLLESADRDVARAETGLTGQPIFFSLGSLLRGKDPMTVLEGFERSLGELPAARLYMAFLRDDLLEWVRERIAASEALSRSVELLGRIPYDRIGPYLNSADILLAGSHYEGSGYAVIDALACGVVPVVTDIPSFRYITGDCGERWRPGDPEALRTAILEVAERPLEPQRRAARERFERDLSYAAIGRKAVDAYRQVLERRRNHRR